MHTETRIESVPLPTIASPLRESVKQDIGFARMMLDLGRKQQAIKLANAVIPPRDVRINLHSRSKTHATLLNNAAYTWNYLLEKDIFLISTNPESEIQIKILPQTYFHDQEVAGHVHWERKAQHICAIMEVTQDEPAAMLHTFLHELGHILGLDENNTENGIMSPMDRNNPLISPNGEEVKALRWLDQSAQEVLDIANQPF